MEKKYLQKFYCFLCMICIYMGEVLRRTWKEHEKISTITKYTYIHASNTKNINKISRTSMLPEISKDEE